MHTSSTLGVVLAGGRSQRMAGGNKSLMPFGQATLLEQVIARAQPQVNQLVVNYNGDSETLPKLGLPVLRDDTAGKGPAAYLGPLAGIISAMAWAKHQDSGHEWLATFAVDTPFVPDNFVEQCLATAQDSGVEVVYASSGGRNHYAMAVWRIALLPHLEQLIISGERALESVLAASQAKPCEFNTASPDPFFNINTRNDWLQAQRYLHHAKK